MGRPRRLHRFGHRLTAAAAVLLAAGCLADLGASLGSGAARGGLEELESAEGRRAVRAVTDSTIAGVRVAFREDLAPTLDSAAGSVLARGESTLAEAEATAGRMEDSLAASVRGELAASVEELVRRTVERAGAEGREELDATTARLGRNLERDLVPILAPAVREATRELVSELSRGVRNELGVAAESAVARAVRTGVRASTEEAEDSGIWQTVVRLAIGAGAIALLWIGAWLWRGHRRRDAALKAVAQAVKERGDDDLRRHIKRRTTQRQVEGWFRDYLQSTGFLVSSDRNESVADSGEGGTDG